MCRIAPSFGYTAAVRDQLRRPFVGTQALDAGKDLAGGSTQSAFRTINVSNLNGVRLISDARAA